MCKASLLSEARLYNTTIIKEWTLEENETNSWKNERFTHNADVLSKTIKLKATGKWEHTDLSVIQIENRIGKWRVKWKRARMEIITEWYTSVTKTWEHGPHDYVEKNILSHRTGRRGEWEERSGWFDGEVKTASLFVAHLRRKFPYIWTHLVQHKGTLFNINCPV